MKQGEEMTTVVTNSLFLKKVIRTFIIKEYKISWDVLFGVVVKGSAERVGFPINIYLNNIKN